MFPRLNNILELHFKIDRYSFFLCKIGSIYEGELFADPLYPGQPPTSQRKSIVIKVIKQNSKKDPKLMKVAWQQEVSIMWALKGCRQSIELIGYTDEPLTIVTKLYRMSLFDYLFHSITSPQNNLDLLPTEFIIPLAYDIAKGCQAIHKIGIVHHDLKTVNILLDEVYKGKYRAVICDFGKVFDFFFFLYSFCYIFW